MWKRDAPASYLNVWFVSDSNTLRGGGKFVFKVFLTVHNGVFKEVAGTMQLN